jgi:hypothetical protein
VALLTVYPISRAGDSKAYVAADVAGDTFPNDGKTFLHYKNTNAATRTVTANSIRPCDQGFDHNETCVVGATTGDEMMGTFPPSRYNDPTTGLVGVTYDAVTNLTVAALRADPTT